MKTIIAIITTLALATVASATPPPFVSGIDNSNDLENEIEIEVEIENEIENDIRTSARGGDASTSFVNLRAASSSASLYSAQCKKEASGQGMAFGFAVGSVEGFCTSYLVWDKLSEMCRLEPTVNVLVQDEVVEAPPLTTFEPAEPTYSYQDVPNPKCADAEKMYEQTIVEYEGIVGAGQWRAIGRKYVPFLFTILPL